MLNEWKRSSEKCPTKQCVQMSWRNSRFFCFNSCWTGALLTMNQFFNWVDIPSKTRATIKHILFTWDVEEEMGKKNRIASRKCLQATKQPKTSPFLSTNQKKKKKPKHTATCGCWGTYESCESDRAKEVQQHWLRVLKFEGFWHVWGVYSLCIVFFVCCVDRCEHGHTWKWQTCCAPLSCAGEEQFFRSGTKTLCGILLWQPDCLVQSVQTHLRHCLNFNVNSGI